MTNKEFESLEAEVYRDTGMRIGMSRRKPCEAFVATRMSELALPQAGDYLRHLVLSGEEERTRLINAVTINETFFFRDYSQLRAFGEHALPEILHQKDQQGSRRLRLLSAGCATGEEPYTLSILLQELIEDYHEWDIRIDAVDVNTDSLLAARKGLYGPRSVKDVPISYRMTHFETGPRGLLSVGPEVRRPVHLAQSSIINRQKMALYAGLDIVFCRNVLIYFDDASRAHTMMLLHDLLLPGGFVFLGYAESASRFSLGEKTFEMCRLGETIAHRRPLETVL